MSRWRSDIFYFSTLLLSLVPRKKGSTGKGVSVVLMETRCRSSYTDRSGNYVPRLKNPRSGSVETSEASHSQVTFPLLQVFSRSTVVVLSSTWVGLTFRFQYS